MVAPMREPFVHRMPVRFADTDAQGHMYFANYLTFCDEALAAFMRARGCPWQALVEEGVDMFYVSARCDYAGSARFEEALAIEVSLARVGRTSVTSAYVVRGPGGEELARAELVSVCVDVETRAPTPVPERLRALVTPPG